MKNEEEIPPAPSIGYLYLAVAFVAAFWLANLWYGSGLDDDHRGLFGDMFGAVNALFSGLAFAGVAYAIAMQRYEVDIARRENRDTKRLLSAQEQQIQRQNEATEKQVFEETFFQLLRLQNDIAGRVETRTWETGSVQTVIGKDAIAHLVIQFRTLYTPGWMDAYDEQSYDEAFAAFSEARGPEVGHYFRMLYNIFKFVDNSPVKDKKFYTNIVRAQLSNHEVELLFYNGMGRVGRPKFKPLIEKYALLKNFAVARTDPPPYRMFRYDPSAYGKPDDGSRLGFQAWGLLQSDGVKHAGGLLSLVACGSGCGKS
ncbi:putative phage abortive infection protein [Pararhizobium sp. A13]|uniref:putative phage abortive infection protein n=1 Tax=Pararhizobium sp. A13 TaxID=3133975 RepID=UPI003244367B